MIQELKFKPDFAKTAARFEAWWAREIVDRPPVSLWVNAPRAAAEPTPAVGAILQRRHGSLREQWFDVEYNVERSIAGMAAGEFLADTLPVYWPNLGPEISATLYGCELEFGESTSWSKPVIHEASDWDRIARAEPSFDNPYWRAMEEMTAYAMARNEGRYLVGLTDLHGAYDILAGLRDPQALCMDLLDCPELVRRAGERVATGFVEAFTRNYCQVADVGHGSICWTPCWHAGPAYVPSCDFWCMVSPPLARELIWPTVCTEMEPLARSIFHLDGPQALAHLDLLLEHPGLNAVQWVYGAGQGPAARWTDVYRRIQQAGKGIQLLAESASDALAVMQHLKPEGVWICVGEGFASRAEADAFLKVVAG